jgi:hypothetical protein
MKRISWNEFKAMCQKSKDIVGYVVYKASNWSENYTEKERTYKVSADNKYFDSSKLCNSLFGDCLDGKDLGVRLDYYNWDVDYVNVEERYFE